MRLFCKFLIEILFCKFLIESRRADFKEERIKERFDNNKKKCIPIAAKLDVRK